MHDLGVGTTRKMRSVITGIFFPSLRCKTYTVKERLNIWKGKAISMKFPVVSEGIRFNAFEDVDSLEIQIYFFAGKYDYTCCYYLQKEFYERINATIKEFYSFDNSAHSPLFEEPKKAIRIFKEIL